MAISNFGFYFTLKFLGWRNGRLRESGSIVGLTDIKMDRIDTHRLHHNSLTGRLISIPWNAIPLNAIPLNAIPSFCQF